MAPILVEAIVRRDDLPPFLIQGTAAAPPVRVALAILDGEAGVLRSHLGAWLGPSFASALAPLSDAGLQQVASAILFDHSKAVTERHPARVAKAPASRDAEPADMMESVWAVASEIGIPPDAVLSMPWTDFLSALLWIPTARKRALVDAATAARIAQADAEGWSAFVGSVASPKGRRSTDEDKAAAKAQADLIRAQLDRKRATGSSLPRSDAERDADAENLAKLAKAYQTTGEA